MLAFLKLIFWDKPIFAVEQNEMLINLGDCNATEQQ